MLFSHSSVITLRSFLFNLFFPLWTLVLAVVCLPFLFLPVSLAWVGYVWAKGTLIALRLFCGIRMDIQGREHIPQDSAYIIASKHQSAWDTLIFHLLCQRPVYVLKKELTYIPLFGRYLTRMGMIAIDRSGKASSLKELLKASNDRLKQKRPVIIFPEGTRTMPGEIVPYQPGIAAIYSQGHAMVVPVALNSGLYWRKNAFQKKPGCITLEFLPPILPGLKRDEFMQQVETRIEEASARLLKA